LIKFLELERRLRNPVFGKNRVSDGKTLFINCKPPPSKSEKKTPATMADALLNYSLQGQKGFYSLQQANSLSNF